MDYLLKASGLVVILFLFYILFLRNETFFKSIRGYFLAGLIITVSIPLIEIPVYVETATSQINMLNYKTVTTSNQTKFESIDWLFIFTLIYLAGVLLFSLKFLVQLTSLAFLISKHSFHKKGSYFYIETKENISPFSFFNIIIYNKSQFSQEELELIINHEKAHALQWHSLDTILAHLLVITLWFNPFVWLYKKAVQQNLEFLADSYAIKHTKNQKLYQFTLLKTSGLNYCTQITNNFYNSLIKNRIIMIHKNKSTNKNQWKYLLLLPILMVFINTFNTKLIAQEKKLVQIKEVTIDLIIDKNTTDFELERESNTFKTETNIDLKFKGVKRNSKNEIIAIKIDAKGENLKSKFENSGNEPIKPIKISFDSDNNNISIGNLAKIHKNHYSYTIHNGDKMKFNGKQNKDGNYIFISSDDKNTSWSSKDSDTIIHKNKIIIKSNDDDEHVWVSKDDKDIKVEVIEVKDGKKVIKIIENGDTKVIEEEIEIIHEGDHKSENVFIIKSDDLKITKEKKEQKEIKGEKATKESKEQKVFFKSASNQEPLFILDGKEISNEEMKKLDPDSIKSINVLKGESASKKYGKKGENGVVEIQLK